MPRREQTNHKAHGERQAELYPDAALHVSVNSSRIRLLPYERAAVERLKLLRYPDDALTAGDNPGPHERARLSRPSRAIAREHLDQRRAEVGDFLLQLIDSWTLHGRIDDGHVLAECLVGNAKRLFHLLTVVGGRAWIGIEQRVAHVDGAEQHLRANRRNELLRAHVAFVNCG